MAAIENPDGSLFYLSGSVPPAYEDVVDNPPPYNEAQGQLGLAPQIPLGQPLEEDEIAKEKRENAKKPMFLTHNVLPTDTLQGLAIRYSTTVQQIRRYNEFIGDHFAHLSTLRIPAGRIPDQLKEAPLSEERKKRMQHKLTKSMADACRIDFEEAHFYMSEHAFNLQAAMDAFKSDVDWEKTNKGKKKLVPSFMMR